MHRGGGSCEGSGDRGRFRRSVRRDGRRIGKYEDLLRHRHHCHHVVVVEEEVEEEVLV